MVGVTLDNGSGSTIAAGVPTQVAASQSQTAGFEASMQQVRSTDAGELPSQEILIAKEPKKSQYLLAKESLEKVIGDANDWLLEARDEVDKGEKVGKVGPMQAGIDAVQVKLNEAYAVMYDHVVKMDKAAMGKGSFSGQEGAQELGHLERHIIDTLDRAKNAGEHEKTGNWVYR